MRWALVAALVDACASEASRCRLHRCRRRHPRRRRPRRCRRRTTLPPRRPSPSPRRRTRRTGDRRRGTPPRRVGWRQLLRPRRGPCGHADRAFRASRRGDERSARTADTFRRGGVPIRYCDRDLGTVGPRVRDLRAHARRPRRDDAGIGARREPPSRSTAAAADVRRVRSSIGAQPPAPMVRISTTSYGTVAVRTTSGRVPVRPSASSSVTSYVGVTVRQPSLCCVGWATNRSGRATSVDGPATAL